MSAGPWFTPEVSRRERDRTNDRISVDRTVRRISEREHAADPSGVIRVALADDSYLIREAMQQVLAGARGVEVVAVCEDGVALLDAVDRLRPTVVVTDLRMPPSGDDEGIRLAAALRSTHPAVGVVVLTQYAEPRYGVDLLADGAEGRAYLVKERIHGRGELLAAIEVVARGGSVIDPTMVEMLMRPGRDESPLAELTPRELEVLREMAQGKSNAAIAESLVLTKRAVEKHVGAIFLKLGLQDEEVVSRRVAAVLMYLAEDSLS
jgi:DNA-binding NarL/FixJ family response regulator